MLRRVVRVVVERDDLPLAARRALRLHGVVVAVCTTSAAVNALVAIPTLGRVELDERWIGVLVAVAAIAVAAGLGLKLLFAVERVRAPGAVRDIRRRLRAVALR